MNTIIAGAVRASLLAAALAFSVAQAQNAPEPAPSKAAKKKPAKTAKPATAGKVKFVPGSAETVAERAARLKRECKGRVNAGACEGYAS